MNLRPKSNPKLWLKLKPLARQMRHEATPAENKLWQRLRRQALGVKFRRQHAIDRFIVDFIALEQNLVIEVDGAIHDYTAEEDAIRQQFLEEVYGLQFLRFSNGDVIQEIDAVIERIGEVLNETHS